MADDTIQLSIGQIVKSRAGRDKGGVFLVYEIVDNEYVLLVDGKLRKIDNPKKKKQKHLTVYNTVLSDLIYRKDNDIKITNSYIRKLLAPFQPEEA
ncbi:MAG: hypothetical protein GX291_06490 [Tissierellia bacterium]|jgi:ribosomal protein L14E/L6E/L27E|nr:KOW domain-containing RNA-binding protein [Bacillota bacterium]NLK58902.1 hypothetical protein [Tissierellia bacterium]